MHGMSCQLPWAVAVVALVMSSACDAPRSPAARARDVERRILAPCCRRQTLEDHDSEIARALRTEIERRAAAGEPAVAIEDDLVRRYGEDVRAMPRALDPRLPLGVGLGGVVLLGALVLLRHVSRRRSPPRVTASAVSDPGIDDEYEERLDDELLAAD